MLGPTVMERSKRALAPKGGTKKDQKATMLRADKSDKIPTIHPSQNGTTTHGCGYANDERPQRTGVKRLDELVHQTDSPFIAPVTSFPLS